ncbi:MAG: lysine--tRNA ligase [Methanobrevibacter sp.]|jgi:lysyl-tRNA synthetase class 1|nr:lysine--tRNA ligase [Candidatus Methanovirga basalitermitum]
MEHWIEKIVNDLNDMDVEKHVIASGTSISGSIHIGNSCDIFIASCLGKKLREMGRNCETIWMADDYDPLRKVPYPLPSEFKKYLGVPYYNIPSPDGIDSNFVEHFEKPLFDVLDDYGIELTHYSLFETYKKGLYDNYIRTALDDSEKIREIFNQYRKQPLNDDWLPYNPICEKCGRVNTTYSHDYNGDLVSYICDCGYEGEIDIKSGSGKLTWRVEWAARWKIFNVTCEPFGKDHATNGGSYDVSKIISSEIFNYPAPYPVPYEWITLDGDVMSKSKGIFFTPKQWLSIGPPESLNYFIFRSKPMKHKDFSPKMHFLDFIEQFDKVEKVYYDEEQAPSEKEERKFKKIYEIAKISDEDRLPFRPPYRFLTVAYQIIGGNLEGIFEILKKNSQLSESFKYKGFKDLNEEEINEFEKRLENVANWLDKYAPKFVKFNISRKIPKLEFKDDEKIFLKSLAILVENNDFNDATELHDKMYKIIHEHELKPQKAFQTIYKVTLGQKKGPKAASFLLSLEKNFLIKRLRLEA